MKCNESSCFAQFSKKDGSKECMCLDGKPYPKGACPFRKLDGCITNGVDYSKKGGKK